jgi:hypothetical protein
VLRRWNGWGPALSCSGIAEFDIITGGVVLLVLFVVGLSVFLLWRAHQDAADL